MGKELIAGWNALAPISKPSIRFHPWNFNPFGGNDFWVEIPDHKLLKKPVSGWCSYYAFGENVSESKIWSNVQLVARDKKNLPLNYFIVDDGWCFWGDWTEPDLQKFPSGLRSLSLKIREEGFEMGIWFSPFQVDPKSKLIKDHPDWVVRKNGKPVVGFCAFDLFGWKSVNVRYLLDFKNPRVYEYLISVVDLFAADWGVGLIKLDYMYAPYFYPGLSSEDEASVVVRKLLSYIKEKYPKVYTVGCGPFSDLANRVDSAYFSENIILPRLCGVWPLNSVVHSMRFSKMQECFESRKVLKKVFNLDPDVFVCRKDTGFSENQIEKLLQIIKSVGGNRFLGDDLTKLSQARVEKYIYRLFKD